jgi:hypothetical protein
VVLQQNESVRGVYRPLSSAPKERVCAARTPLARAYRALGHVHEVWSPTISDALDEHWIDGGALMRPATGELQALLTQLGREIDSCERKIVAGAFTLRFGVAASATIGPFMITGYVPALRLQDMALEFDTHVLLARVALSASRYDILASDSAACGAGHALEDAAGLAALRSVLCAQAEPVLHALAAWSGLKPSLLWGLVISAWGNELAKIGSALGCQERALELITRFVASDLPAFRRRPHFYLVRDRDGDRICHVRGSCCLYYRVGSNECCASCPVRARRDDDTP